MRDNELEIILQNLLKLNAENEIVEFKEIENIVLLDDDSNGSHLPTWFNLLNAFQKELAQ